MRLLTFYKAYKRTRSALELLEYTRGSTLSIGVADDFAAKRWQRRARQHRKLDFRILRKSGEEFDPTCIICSGWEETCRCDQFSYSKLQFSSPSLTCAVCESEAKTNAFWCSSCVVASFDRHADQIEKWLHKYEGLEFAAKRIIEQIENLPDDAFGMTSWDDLRFEWPLKKEIEMRLRYALAEGRKR